MYIWCAIDVSEQLPHVRQRVEEVCAERRINNPALTLPLHISLKISCEIADECFCDAKSRISDYLSAIPPFKIRPLDIQREGGIIWIRHFESEELSALHTWLVELFSKEYGVAPHKFDGEFAYHTTLMYLESEEIAFQLMPLIKDEPLPDRLLADSFVIGCSESGRAGEYRVVKSIENKYK